MVTKRKSEESKDAEGLLPLLKKAQAKDGYVTPEFITRLSSSMNIPAHEIYAVVSFYSFIYLRPTGRHIIRVCRSLPCEMKPGSDTAGILTAELGIIPGQTTSDGRFSLELTNCIGLCDQAPAMLIDGDPHVSLTPEKVRRIIKTYK